MVDPHSPHLVKVRVKPYDQSFVMHGIRSDLWIISCYLSTEASFHWVGF